MLGRSGAFRFALSPPPGRRWLSESRIAWSSTVDDLTILCGWAEAVAESLAYAPNRVGAALRIAAAGSPWRADLGLDEPSDPLRRAIQLMDDVVSNTAASNDHLDAILAAVGEDVTSSDDALTGLVRRVLLAALELREGRRRHEEVQRAT